MLSFKLDTNDLDEYLIRTQRSLQKTLRRAINTGIKRAHTEGYKILRENLFMILLHNHYSSELFTIAAKALGLEKIFVTPELSSVLFS